MTRFFAKKAQCALGHTHASQAEGKRCTQLFLLVRAGAIDGLSFQPSFTFEVNGRQIKMRNGQAMRYTGDFGYTEDGRQVVEEVKAKNGFMTRDVPVKIALMAAFYPEIELRVVT